MEHFPTTQPIHCNLQTSETCKPEYLLAGSTSVLRLMVMPTEYLWWMKRVEACRAVQRQRYLQHDSCAHTRAQPFCTTSSVHVPFRK